LVNGLEVLIDEDSTVAPMIKDNRTLVPMRFVGEALRQMVKLFYIRQE